MTVLDPIAPAADTATRRTPRPRRYLMCRPNHFAVTYAINPWMDLTSAVDVEAAVRQWERLRRTYLELGHQVEVIEPLVTQPDMVFSANGALVVGSRAYGARFRHPERAAEAAVYAARLATLGIDVAMPEHVNEGEGDFLTLGHVVLAGTGFRTSLPAHVEAAAVIDRPVVSLELVDPRFYHLDTALAVLDDGNGEAPADIAYYPAAFSPHSRRTLRDLFPDALLCSAPDALAFGLNAVSDGLHVVLPAAASRFAEDLRDRGYVPIRVELDELLKAGGSVKCCTMELHR